MTMARRIAVSALISLGLLWIGFNIWFFVGEKSNVWQSPVNLPAGLWQVVEGSGTTDDGLAELTGPDRMGWASAAAQLMQPVPVGRVQKLRFRIRGAGGAFEMSAGVAAPGGLAGYVDFPIAVDSGGVGELDLDELFFRHDEIGYVIFRARGALDPPVRIVQASLVPARPTVVQLQGLIWRSLVNLDDWTQRSINQQIPDFSPLRIAAGPAVVLWIVVSVSVYWVFFVRRLPDSRCVMPVAVFALFGWLALDAIWQLRLWTNHGRAFSNFWGVSTEERWERDVSGDIYSFMRELKANIDKEDRVLILSDHRYSGWRAAYFAPPFSAFPLPGLSEYRLRRSYPANVVAAVDVEERLVEEEIDVDLIGNNSRESIQWPFDQVVGPHAEVVSSKGAVSVRMREGEGPWLIRQGWHDLEPGVWRLEVDLGVEERAGWLRLEVLSRSEDNPAAHVNARRSFYFEQGAFRSSSLAFMVREGEKVHFRVREMRARGSYATAVRAVPLSLEGEVLLLSVAGDPPYFLGRKLVETEAGVAYEIF